MLGEGFDDAWEPPSRPLRPVYFSISELEDAVFLSRNILEDLRAKVTGGPNAWVALMHETLDLARDVIAGRFAEALSSRTGAAILGAADEFEATDTNLSDLASVTAAMRKRIARLLDAYDVDEFADPPGSSETPRVFRALCVALVASALLNLYVQVCRLRWRTGCPSLSTCIAHFVSLGRCSITGQGRS